MHPSKLLFSSNTDELNCINSIYRINNKINEGAFGFIYEGLNLVTKTQIAIKIEKSSSKAKGSLAREAKILRSLQNIAGIPKIFWFGRDKNKDVKALVMQLLGKSLEERLIKQKKFSLKTILLLAEQLIEILKNIHSLGIVHRDIKPANIVLGYKKAYKTIYLIDFGISKRYLKKNSGEHIILTNFKPFIGTIRFASEAAHQGFELSRKDDLESLGYTLIFMLKGVLPWMHKGFKLEEKKVKVGEIKGKISLDELCSGLPSIFPIYFKYVKNLGFYETPNYDYLKNLFTTLEKCFNVKIQTNYSELMQNTSKSHNNSLNVSLDHTRTVGAKLKQKNQYQQDEYEPGITERPEIVFKMNKLNNVIIPKNIKNHPRMRGSKTICCQEFEGKKVNNSYLDGSKDVYSNNKSIFSDGSFNGEKIETETDNKKTKKEEKKEIGLIFINFH